MNKHNIKIWADQQDWSQGYTAVAKANNLAIPTVYSRAKLLGIEVQKAPRGPKLKVRDFDWSMTNTELAKKHGLSHQRVWQLRHKMNRLPSAQSSQFRHPLQDALNDGHQIKITCIQTNGIRTHRVAIESTDYLLARQDTNLFQAIHNAATEYREFKELIESPESDKPEPEFPYSLP